MKYPNFEQYDKSKKIKAVAEELRIDTHNGTTKDDFLNMIRFLAKEVVELQAKVYDLEESTGFVFSLCKNCGCYEENKGCTQFRLVVDPDNDGCTFYTDGERLEAE